ncbi:MAG: type II secretion system protein M [Pseudomonadota bacterium]|nr:type II secretion system protein M [Pseudomonadota bacterium]
MNAAVRRALSALGILAFVAFALGGAASVALSLREAKAHVAELNQQVEQIQARERRLAPLAARDPAASPFFEAGTVTLAGAALQQRVEAVVASAKGRLVSSKVEVAPHGDARRISLTAELTIAEADMQALLYDLETGRPYLFVDAIEARAPEAASGPGAGAMRVSLTVSGQWSGTK